jgi:hypothetical protein
VAASPSTKKYSQSYPDSELVLTQKEIVASAASVTVVDMPLSSADPTLPLCADCNPPRDVVLVMVQAASDPAASTSSRGIAVSKS